jgi:hypothetical protein
MANEKLLLYKEGVKIPVSNEKQNYVRKASRSLREKFKSSERTTCDIDLQKQMLEKLYTTKEDRKTTSTNPDKIK